MVVLFFAVDVSLTPFRVVSCCGVLCLVVFCRTVMYCVVLCCMFSVYFRDPLYLFILFLCTFYFFLFFFVIISCLYIPRVLLLVD